MILSWRHGFLFIKTVKTAGTSIEVDLAPLLDDDAIVTPIEPAVAGHTPRNVSHPKGDFFNHMLARDIRDRIGAEAYGRLFKFCVEREPVAKCLSHFHMLKRADHTAASYRGTTWEDYCRAGKFPLDMWLYSARGKGGREVLVDRFLRYETLAEELSSLLDGLGVKGFALRSREKSHFSADRLVGPDDVTDEQRALIYRAFKPSLNLHKLYPLPEGI